MADEFLDRLFQDVDPSLPTMMPATNSSSPPPPPPLASSTQDPPNPLVTFETLANAPMSTITDFNAYVDMMCDVGDKVDNFGSFFSRHYRLNAAPLFYAFMRNIVSPVDYLKTVKTFSPTVAMVLDGKWGDVIARSGRNMAKRKVLVLLADLISDPSRDSSSIKTLGRFMQKIAHKPNAAKLCKKYDLDPAVVASVIAGMNL